VIKLIPSRETTTGNYRIITHPTQTYGFQFKRDRITQWVDGLEAMKQTIYKILHTERYQYLIYNWNYGIELADLMGKPIPYVKAELPRRIKEALIIDDRILEVTDFSYKDTDQKSTLAVSFHVKTIYGNLSASREVDV